MKKSVFALALVGITGMPAAATTAEEPHSLTANLEFTSNYRFRGISQTFNGPAIQGGLDYAQAGGFYLGLWATNVDSGELAGSNLEGDLYGGYTFSLDDVTIDAGGLYYWYPGNDEAAYGTDPDTFELHAGVAWKWLGVRYSHGITRLFGLRDSRASGYLETNAVFKLPAGARLDLHAGRQFVTGDIAPGISHHDYTDWKIGISRSMFGLDIGLAYVDTDITPGNVTWGGLKSFAGGSRTADLTHGAVVLTVGTSKAWKIP